MEMTIVVMKDTEPTLEVISGNFPGTWQTLEEGVEQFIDRHYVLTNIPKHLIGARFFQGPCHSRSVELKVVAHGPVLILESMGHITTQREALKIVPATIKTGFPSMKTNSFSDESVGFWQHGIHDIVIACPHRLARRTHIHAVFIHIPPTLPFSTFFVFIFVSMLAGTTRTIILEPEAPLSYGMPTVLFVEKYMLCVLLASLSGLTSYDIIALASR